MSHSFVTVTIPFEAGRLGSVHEELSAFGNLHRQAAVDPAPPATAEPACRLRERLDAVKIIHFLSFNTLDDDGRGKAQLIVEMTVDGAARPALGVIGRILVDEMPAVLAAVQAPFRTSDQIESLVSLLEARSRTISPGWFTDLGLLFAGTPGMTVTRIRSERDLAKSIAGMLERGALDPSSSLQTLRNVRNALWEEGQKWAFVPEPISWLSTKRWHPLAAGAVSVALMLWPFLLGLLVAACVLQFGFGVPAIILPLTGVGIAGYTYWRFRRQEQSDIPNDMAPRRRAVEQLLEQENHASQNHLFAVSTLKPGLLRRLALRLAFALVGGIVARTFRPGFLGDIGTIHFARWLLVPGTDKLVFLSNYGGSWESYLEDFIEKAHAGLTGIWSNTVGFPKTSNLFWNGATDGDRFKRWARREQRPTLLWYSAYPTLTTARIRLNALIRQGVACATTESDALDWLACFGSSPRPPAALETPEIPSLIFGGLSRLSCGQALILEFGTQGSTEWLAALQPSLSYGERVRDPDGEAVILAFSASGLRKLGLAEHDLNTFPPAFQDGMSTPSRARALGDLEDNAPDKWRWGGANGDTDAVMLLYTDSEASLVRLVAKRRTELTRFGHREVDTITFCTLRQRQNITSAPAVRTENDRSNDDLHKEPFGFSDGISQPIIRGTRRWTRIRDANHVVSPGEFVLGYPDNRNFLPPSPSVQADADPQHLLPSFRGDPFRERPDFSRPLSAGERDLGRNGTFLVVRELEQDVAGFETFIQDHAESLAGNPSAPAAVEERREWIAAKLIGRWKDGTSLVRYPNGPGTAAGRVTRPDNDFLYGTDDADGRRCPFGAHIRRANPRDSLLPGSPEQLAISNRHRILRVGRDYVTRGSRRNPGLFFMCLNADIERQFEFVQQTWASAPSFHGLEGEVDCLAARGSTDRITIPTSAGPLYLKRLSDFVRVRGGGYFFLPSRRAIRFLASIREDRPLSACDTSQPLTPCPPTYTSSR